jgi:hypothetical protein
MARRKFLAGFVLALGSLAGAVAYRRRFGRRRERVDLYYEDGAMVSREGSSPEGERLLPLARDVLRAART